MVAALTQAWVVLDQRHEDTPGWEPLAQSARLGWASLAAALDVNLGRPDPAAVDHLGWRPKTKVITGPARPGVLGVLQAQHSLVVRMKPVPHATNLRLVVDSNSSSPCTSRRTPPAWTNVSPSDGPNAARDARAERPPGSRLAPEPAGAHRTRLRAVLRTPTPTLRLTRAGPQRRIGRSVAQASPERAAGGRRSIWRRSTALVRSASPRVRAGLPQQGDALDVLRHREVPRSCRPVLPSEPLSGPASPCDVRDSKRAPSTPSINRLRLATTDHSLRSRLASATTLGRTRSSSKTCE